MSIVAVHGPNTFGSKAIVQAGAAVGTVDPTNGLKWDFRLAFPTPRSDQDFSWAFPTDGTPTPQTLADPAVVTYATPGSKTATLTVTNTSRTVSNKALTSNVATLTTTATHGFKVGQSVVVFGVGGVGQDDVDFAIEHAQDFFLDVSVRRVRALLVLQRRSVSRQALDVGGRAVEERVGFPRLDRIGRQRHGQRMDAAAQLLLRVPVFGKRR
jgi:hypothetical protein